MQLCFAPMLEIKITLNRFSESINTVKDVAEKSLESESSVLSNVEKSVKKDISNEFNDYGHHMWDLK